MVTIEYSYYPWLKKLSGFVKVLKEVEIACTKTITEYAKLYKYPSPFIKVMAAKRVENKDNIWELRREALDCINIFRLGGLPLEQIEKKFNELRSGDQEYSMVNLDRLNEGFGFGLERSIQHWDKVLSLALKMLKVEEREV